MLVYSPGSALSAGGSGERRRIVTFLNAFQTNEEKWYNEIKLRDFYDEEIINILMNLFEVKFYISICIL